MSKTESTDLLRPVTELQDRVTAGVAEELIGFEVAVRDLLVAMLNGGHVLLEGVPGTGKTTLVKRLGVLLGLKTGRIQFTPDLMPTDIVGTNVLVEDRRGRQHVEFEPGPLFANLVLADEINRATPKTQSALLEAMQEATVSIAGTTYELPQPFTVIATQNPIEMEGTYPLPEAQLDRFFVKTRTVLPSRERLEDVLALATRPPNERRAPGVARGEAVRPAARAGSVQTDPTRGDGPKVQREPGADGTASGPGASGATATHELLFQARRIVDQLPVTESVRSYAARLIRASQPESEFCPAAMRPYVRFGASPRAGVHLVRGARALAALEGRPTPDVEDIRAVAIPVLRHRLVRTIEADADGVDGDELVRQLLQAIRPA